jgi:hypothetical protein
LPFKSNQKLIQANGFYVIKFMNVSLQVLNTLITGRNKDSRRHFPIKQYLKDGYIFEIDFEDKDKVFIY